MKRTVVIGAGYAGLAAADRLRSEGAEVTVIEGRDRVGGRVWSAPFGERGAIVERGAEFILPGYDVMEGLAERFGIPLVLKGTPYGRRIPVGDEAVPPEELERAFELINGDVPGDPASVADAIGALELGPGLSEVIRARVQISTGHPAEDLEVAVLERGASAFGDFDNFTLEGGNMRLADALAGELGDSLHISSPVRAIRWGDDGVTVATDEGEAEADAAVVAVPASVLDQIEFQPALSGPTAAALSAVRMGHNAKLFVEMRSPSPPSAILSVAGHFWTYTQLGADGEPAPFVVGYAGTMPAIEALTAGGAAPWVEAVVALRSDLELESDPARALLSTWHDDPWVRGAYSAGSLAEPLREDDLERPIGPLFFAGEHTAREWHGLMEGALRSGIRAADQVLAG